MSKTDVKGLFEAFLEAPNGPKKLKTAPRNTKVLREGNAIVIPENMEYIAGANALMALAKQDEEDFNREEEFTCHPNDGYIAVHRTIEDSFGPVGATGKEFFGMKMSTPEMKRIKTGLGINDYVEAFCDGDIQIPTLPGVVINVAGFASAMLFAVRVTAKKKHSRAINAFLDEVGRRIREESIYKGKAFDSQFNFLDLSGAKEDRLVLPEAAAIQIRANLFAPLKWKDALKRIGTPFKRTILLEGPYGCGKTLSAYVAGALAVEAGATFIYIRPEDADNLALYMRYARQYASNGDGAVIFYEDIDLLMGSDDSERNSKVNTVLNTLDGIDGKTGAAQDVMLVLTSNNAETINEALLRPGRIDAVIHIDAPDAEAAGRLLRMYGGDLLSPDFDYHRAGVACAGMTPAFIREVVDRSKLVALDRTSGETNYWLIADDIISAAAGIQKHLELASPRVAKYNTGDRLASALREVVGQTVRPLVDTSTRSVAKIAGSSAHIITNNWESNAPQEERQLPLLEDFAPGYVSANGVH